ncbi:MAG: flagellar basal body-associated FliL family protein [Oricola sp.]
MLKPVTMAPAPAEPAKAAEVMEPETTAPADAHGAAPAHGAPAKEAEARRLPENLTVVDIPAVTTNLLDPPDTWIRMELSLAYDGSDDEMLSQEIQQDILAYVRTMKLYNLRGGSGYQHLIEDLNDRAAIRSEGRVKRVLVRSFILE